jgi:hypothetical protein
MAAQQAAAQQYAAQQAAAQQYAAQQLAAQQAAAQQAAAQDAAAREAAAREAAMREAAAREAEAQHAAAQASAAQAAVAEAAAREAAAAQAAAAQAAATRAAAAQAAVAPTPAAPASSGPGRRKSVSDARAVQQVENPTDPVGPIGRGKSTVQVEEILSELFERTQEVYNIGQDREKGMDFLLDLAMEKIPADAGSVFIAELESPNLSVSAARGPKASELKKMKLKIPIGKGIVGFCAMEAVSVAISDTERDPRFHKEVSEKLGYKTNSILCCPMVSGGRTYGCLEIINKKGNSQFSVAELHILAYVAHQGARFLETI